MSKKETKKVEPKKKAPMPPAPEVKAKPQPPVEDQTDFEQQDEEVDEDPEGLEESVAKSKVKFRCNTCGAKFESADQLEFKDDQGKEHSYCPNCFQKWIHRFVPTLQNWTET